MSIDCAALDIPTGNLAPILHEIAHALRHWLDEGISHAIDLRSLPLAPQEENQLLELLGEGEITAQLDVLGDSTITETRYPGVWLITHFNETHTVSARAIEITDVPELLKSQRVDVEYGLQRLQLTLEEQP